MTNTVFKNAILSCFLAGSVAFFLFGTMFLGMPFAVLAFFRPLPLFLIGFKYGSIATFLAGTIMVVFTQLFMPEKQGVIAFFTLAFPAFALMQISARSLIINKIEPRFEPVGASLLFTSILAFVTTLATIITFYGFDYSKYEQSLAKILNKVMETYTSELPITEIINLAPIFLPATGAILWFIFMVGNLYLAWRLAPRFNLKMPPLSLHNTRLPFLSVLLIGIGFGLTYADGLTRLSGFILIGSLVPAFICQGLAVIHAKTIGKSWRKIFLAGFYLTSVLIGWPWLIAFLIGLADPAFIFRKTNGDK